MNVAKNVYSLMTTEQTQSDDEDHLIWLKCPEQVSKRILSWDCFVNSCLIFWPQYMMKGGAQAWMPPRLLVRVTPLWLWPSWRLWMRGPTSALSVSALSTPSRSFNSTLFVSFTLISQFRKIHRLSFNSSSAALCFRTTQCFTLWGEVGFEEVTPDTELPLH